MNVVPNSNFTLVEGYGKLRVSVFEIRAGRTKKIMGLCDPYTADNGKEFAEHETIAQWLNIDFFFSKPYHSWECGANENSNGLIRQYFPKVCSFENITNLQIQYIQHKMSNRSRKN